MWLAYKFEQKLQFKVHAQKWWKETWYLFGLAFRKQKALLVTLYPKNWIFHHVWFAFS